LFIIFLLKLYVLLRIICVKTEPNFSQEIRVNHGRPSDCPDPGDVPQPGSELPEIVNAEFGLLSHLSDSGERNDSWLVTMRPSDVVDVDWRGFGGRDLIPTHKRVHVNRGLLC
jgi:hypothetical protein